MCNRSGGSFLLIFFIIAGVLLGRVIKHLYFYLTRDIIAGNFLMEEKIKKYPILELLNAVCWAAYIACFNLHEGLIYGLFIISMCILISIIDISYYIIPNSLVVVLIIIGLIYQFMYDRQTPLFIFFGFLTGFLVTFLMSVLSKGGLGGGDIKLSAVMGLWLGFPQIISALMISSVVGGLAAIILLLAGKKGHKEPIPFGPFLMIGFLYSYIMI